VSLPVIVRPEARSEYDEAFDWFEARRPGDGVRFATAIQDVFDRIAANPRVHAAVYGTVRKAVVSRYHYYCVYYREHANHVEVLSVFHTSRDPSIWQGRA
jgi:plasmid stabilization system protein ParE